MKSKTLLLGILGLIWVGILGFIYLDSSQDNVTKAEKTINKFMIARLQNNQPEAEMYLTDRANRQYAEPSLTLIGGSNPHFINYKIVETTPETNVNQFQVTFVVRVFEEYSGEERSNAYFDETIVVKMVDKNKFKIDNVRRGEYVYL